MSFEAFESLGTVQTSPQAVHRSHQSCDMADEWRITSTVEAEHLGHEAGSAPSGVMTVPVGMVATRGL